MTVDPKFSTELAYSSACAACGRDTISPETRPSMFKRLADHGYEVLFCQRCATPGELTADELMLAVAHKISSQLVAEKAFADGKQS